MSDYASRPRTVYFIKPVGMDGPIKIGCSASPDGRKRTLETWSPFALEIVATIDGTFDLERRFHALLKPWHERREWFTSSPEVLAVVTAVRAGRFDITTLPAPMVVCTDRVKASANQRATWTPERRVQASYEARVRWTQIKTATVCPRYASMVHDPAVRKAIDAYLADPHKHGETIASFEARQGVKPWWWRTHLKRMEAKARSAKTGAAA